MRPKTETAATQTTAVGTETVATTEQKDSNAPTSPLVPKGRLQSTKDQQGNTLVGGDDEVSDLIQLRSKLKLKSKSKVRVAWHRWHRWHVHVPHRWSPHIHIPHIHCRPCEAAARAIAEAARRAAEALIAAAAAAARAIAAAARALAEAVLAAIRNTFKFEIVNFKASGDMCGFFIGFDLTIGVKIFGTWHTKTLLIRIEFNPLDLFAAI